MATSKEQSVLQMFENLCVSKSVDPCSSVDDNDKKSVCSNEDVGLQACEKNDTDVPLESITTPKAKLDGNPFADSCFEEGESSKEDQGNKI